MKFRTDIYTWLLLLLILLQNFFLFYFDSGLLRQRNNAVGFFLSSFLFGVVLIRKFYKKEVIRDVESGRKPIYFLVLAGAGIILLLFAVINSHIFLKLPIDYRYSDVIPTVQVVVKRFLAGVYPYTPITEFGYYLPVTYLPMHWLPYTIAEKMHFDYRWISYAIWSLASLVLIVRSFKSKDIVIRSLAPMLLLVVYYLITKKNDGILSMTIETMVAGYYMLLIVGLNQDNPILQGIFISICMLSRFSLVLWLPLWAFVLFASGNRKFLFKTLVTIAVFVSVVYIIPFLSKDWGAFYRGYKTYDGAALGEWKHVENDPEKPYHLFRGVGFAYLFNAKLAHLDIMSRIKILQKTHLVLCLASSFVMGLWYWFSKNKIHYKIFLLASFNIYLSIFLAFIQVPYEYLMIVGNFVSIAILFEQGRYRVKQLS